ncbi:hypothetical protein PLESTB_000481500 [Pleodorina starrii]|uniref:Protein arginine N-methyltransferase n=1 Tax=Pleodorina starrii TaxID=330485 RepID=A0A9W6BFJ1_9CHLO|nr:hypothetical protein PLESTM_001584900 [Pleodorina starrii]GLC51242.1 hypothetical protein PLESTB_000481500 [Pleodorina starrii]GLC63601.1 hypothetical protein PLESTF_000053900 [Pleodorina starrii]
MGLGKRTDYGDAKYAGVQVPFTGDVPATVEAYSLCGFDFVVTPLVRDNWRPPAPAVPENGSLPSPFNRDDCLYINSSQWANQVVGQVSDWIQPDSPDPAVRQQSVAALRHQLGWAAHLGLQAVVLPPPHRPARCPNYAQVLSQALQGLTHMALWLTVPLVISNQSEQDQQQGAQQGAQGQGRTEQNGGAGAAASPAGPGALDGWEAWHQVRAQCDHHNLLGAALLVGPTLPSAASLDRWRGESVKAVLLPTAVFTANKRGYPVLSKPHQELLAMFFKMGVQVVLTGEACHDVPPPAPPAPGAPAGAAVAVGPDGSPLGFSISNPGEAHPLRPYWDYLCFLFRRLEAVGEQERQEASYRDYLQVPLQPLQDNLESQTYETFEKDVQKYKLYEEAVYKALKDKLAAAAASSETSSPYDLPIASTSGRGSGRQHHHQTTHGSSSSPAAAAAAASGGGDGGPVVVLMVVGAGRGPLVRASMRAASRAGVRLRVYAVEKNPNAIVHIQQMLRSEGWEADVSIVSADMRHWQAPEPAEILVSELLGSFGDNELSPECLDGAQRFLAPGGISIPQSYTSYLAPATSHKLHHDVKSYKDLEHFETPYVVRLHRHHLLAATQPLFTFSHPNPSEPIDNSRYASVTFTRDPAAGAAVLHGFAGYFECSLYGDVLLSIHPPSHSENMFSWFPIFFPLREPVYVPAGAPVEMQMWRCCSAHKVWYEWAVTAPVAGPIHNVGGRSYWVGL